MYGPEKTVGEGIVKTYYTYLWLREDGTPYYVGKGVGRRAFRKNAPPQDRILVQEFPDEKSSLDAEIFLISYYGRADLGVGCLRNLTDGGEGTSNIAEETRRKMSEAASKRLRTPMSESTRQKIGLANRGRKSPMKGKPKSEETRRRMSLAAMGNKKGLGNKGSFGRKLSAESIYKRIETRKLRPNWNSHQRIDAIYATATMRHRSWRERQNEKIA